MLFSYGRRYIKQYTYMQISNPSFVTPEFLNLVKEHIRFAALDDVGEDQYLTLLITAAVKYAESYTRRVLFNTKFRTFRDSFCTCCFVLERSPFVSIENFEYFKNSVWNNVPIDSYYVTTEEYFARILKPKNMYWDFKPEQRQQCIEIEFTAGYGTDYMDLPPDLLMAILQHVIKMFESRGDCDDASCSAALPAASKMIYDIYKVTSITGQKDCGCRGQ